jgi:integrase
MVADHLRPAAVAAGFHNFRHSLASQLARMKVEPKVVQEMLRHSDLKTTFKFYVQAHDDDKLEAQGSFLKLLLGDKTSLLQGESNGAKTATAHIQ